MVERLNGLVDSEAQRVETLARSKVEGSIRAKQQELSREMGNAERQSREAEHELFMRAVEAGVQAKVAAKREELTNAVHSVLPFVKDLINTATTTLDPFQHPPPTICHSTQPNRTLQPPFPQAPAYPQVPQHEHRAQLLPVPHGQAHEHHAPLPVAPAAPQWVPAGVWMPQATPRESPAMTHAAGKAVEPPEQPPPPITVACPSDQRG